MTGWLNQVGIRLSQLSTVRVKVEVEAELGNDHYYQYILINICRDKGLLIEQCVG